MFTDSYADVFKGDDRWRSLLDAGGQHLRVGRRVDLRAQGPVLRRHARRAAAGRPTSRAPESLPCWAIRSPPTTSARPARSSPARPAAQYLDANGVERKDYNSLGSRRGNHEVMIRGTFANIRLKNQLLDDVSGGYTRDFTQDGGPQAFIYDASVNYKEAGIPLVVLGGKEYGSGSSRDWAAKGTVLLGVKAVITESFERIHRSNLIGMGVIPLQFPAGESAATPEAGRHRGLRHHRHRGAQRGQDARRPSTSPRPRTMVPTVEFDAVVRIDTPGEADYYRNGGILQYVLRNMLKSK